MAIRVFEPHYQPFSEGVRESFEGLDARPMCPVLDAADRGDAGAHALGKLTLRETVSNSSVDDHPREGFVGLESRNLGAVLLAVPGPSTPKPTPMSWLLMLTIHHLGYYQF